MRPNLTAPQQALAEFMTELSEQAFYTTWMDGLEFSLWEVQLGQLTQHGLLTDTSEAQTRLSSLSEACEGWIVFDDVHEETWIPIDDWRRRYATHCGVALDPGDGLEAADCSCGARFHVPYIELDLSQVLAAQNPISNAIGEFRGQSADARRSWVAALLGTAPPENVPEERVLRLIVRHHRRKATNAAPYRCPQCGCTGEAPLHPRY
jgi:hypothetical protein